mgnify:CR=1 FL=1
MFEVFELGDSARNVIYIGRGRIRGELRRYKRSKDSCKMQARAFRYEQMPSDVRARQRERALLNEYVEKHGKLPRCNKRIG